MTTIKHPSVREIYYDIKSKWIVILVTCILASVLAGWYGKSLNNTYVTKSFIEPWGVTNHLIRGCDSELKHADLIINHESLRSFLYCTYGKDGEYDRKLWRLVKEFLISKKLLNDLAHSKKLENFWPASFSTHKDRMSFLEKNIFIKARIDLSLEDVEVLIVLQSPSSLPRRILSEVIHETNFFLRSWWENYWIHEIKLDEMKIKKNILSSYFSIEMTSGYLAEFKSDLQGHLSSYFSKMDEKLFIDIFSRFKRQIPEDTIGMSRLASIEKSLKLLANKNLNNNNDMIDGRITEFITNVNVLKISIMAGLSMFLLIILTISSRRLLTKSDAS